MVDLADIAQKAMEERDFIPNFPQQVLKEADSINTAAIPQTPPGFRDMRDKLWFSIDNDDSLDLDQLTFAEKLPSGNDKLYVAIADVASLIKPQTAIDRQALHNTTSIYTPTKVFPMLPLKFSTDLTSLNERADRAAVVVEIEINPVGETSNFNLFIGWVRNQAKLTYNRVGPWLSQTSTTWSPPPELARQLHLQDQIAQRLKQKRFREGFLSFATNDYELEVTNGKVIGLQPKVHNRAHTLIENCMIAANIAVTQYLMQQKLAILKRVVKTPKRWDRIVAIAHSLGKFLPPSPDPKPLRDFLNEQKRQNPDGYADLSITIIKLIGKGEYVLAIPGLPSPGHFDLAVMDYAHTTAPNRRYPDLIMQRLVKSGLSHIPSPYHPQELDLIAKHCTQKEDDAAKVDRRVRKSAAAMILANQIGQEFSALITGASEKGTWVRLKNPPLEGKLIKGTAGLDVGDQVLVKLVSVDIAKGYIDFTRV